MKTHPSQWNHSKPQGWSDVFRYSDAGIDGNRVSQSIEKSASGYFTTAHADFAVQGFELDAIDYLLKPISMERFLRAVNKATEKIHAQQPASEKKEEDEDFFFVKIDKKLIRINYEDILYIEGLKDYVIIRLETGKSSPSNYEKPRRQIAWTDVQKGA